MKPLSIYLLLFLFITIVSCKKDKKTDPDDPHGDVITENASDYSQLKTGNYWIYQEFKVDSTGVTSTFVYDSCYIEKDTVIRGNTYFKMIKPFLLGLPHTVSYLRDSATCIVNSSGQVQFSLTNFSTPLSTRYEIDPGGDTLYKDVKMMMNDKNISISVPAGTYSTIDALRTIYVNPILAGGGLIRYLHTRYAKNTGIVLETSPIYLGVPGYTERRLVRYHLN